MGDLSPDCYACRGVGYVKPGMGFGAPAYGTFGASPAPMAPGYGAYPPPVTPAYPEPYGAAPYGAAPYGAAPYGGF